jgi:hypothetical protein
MACGVHSDFWSRQATRRHALLQCWSNVMRAETGTGNGGEKCCSGEQDTERRRFSSEACESRRFDAATEMMLR